MGELVQAAQRAIERQQQLGAAAASPAAAGPEAQWEQAARQGAAAQQLLFDCNLRLVGLARRKLCGAASLPTELFEVRRAGGACACCMLCQTRAAPANGRFACARRTR